MSRITITISGPAGSGKTNLMALIGQMLEAKGGAARVVCLDDDDQPVDPHRFGAIEDMTGREFKIVVKAGAQ